MTNVTEISNPGYPTYKNNMNCVWILRTDPTSRINFQVDRYNWYGIRKSILLTKYDLNFSINIESSPSCRYDRLEVSDGLRGQPVWNSTMKLCKRNQTVFFQSSGPYMRLRFITDGSVTRQGFRARAYPGNHIDNKEDVHILLKNAEPSKRKAGLLQ